MTQGLRRFQPFLLTMIVGAFLLSACGSATSTIGTEMSGQLVPVDGGGSYTDLTPGELNKLFSQQDPFFANVHIPYEGEIPNTDAFVPFDEIEANAEVFPSDPDAAIVVYCRSGSMSAKAAEQLTRLGYNQIYNLDGGFRAWKEAGYPFVSP